MARTAATLSIALPAPTHQLRQLPERQLPERETRPRRRELPDPLAHGPRFPSAAMLVGSSVDLGGLSPAELRPA
jgi:hypothetical protein